MLDFHLAIMYNVETRVLKQQIKRNLDRFPEDFMFQLTESEWRELITICDMLGAYKYSPITPLAFTEQGVAMLSGILRSPLAIKVNIAIMRAFVKMRELIEDNKELKEKIEQLEIKLVRNIQWQVRLHSHFQLDPAHFPLNKTGRSLTTLPMTTQHILLKCSPEESHICSKQVVKD